jgi:hypothetical protein
MDVVKMEMAVVSMVGSDGDSGGGANGNGDGGGNGGSVVLLWEDRGGPKEGKTEDGRTWKERREETEGVGSD